MGQDNYDPETYAELMAEKATYLRIDLIDGIFGRARGTEADMADQLHQAGIAGPASERMIGDYIQQLRAIDSAAEELHGRLAALSDVTSEMLRRVRARHPEFKFHGFTV